MGVLEGQVHEEGLLLVALSRGVVPDQSFGVMGQDVLQVRLRHMQLRNRRISTYRKNDLNLKEKLLTEEYSPLAALSTSSLNLKS